MAATDDAPDLDGALYALMRAFAMIIVSEVGDKTFLIAAILAMRQPRLVVFAGAFASLVVMSILSAALGHVLPTLIPRKWTQACAALMFFVFGARMLQEGRAMQGGSDKMREEMKEAEEEIELDEAGHDGDVVPLEAVEEGGRPQRESNGSARPARPPQTKALKEATRNFFSLFLGPVFVQAFVLTFLGEWGDRSQIATIGLAAAHNVYLVALGTIIGHSCCTAVAVTAGRYVSTKVSVKHVTLAGSALFLIFGISYLYEAFLSIDPDDADFHLP
ncbi:UPF0016-domain-containing protein [Sparassis latifolia]|uniref:GDT1 family protein n=1 Tax=Sparassis crispa TaxID=139825 RepID=A0A401G9D3_9APHY|nr:GDT1-like protein [Sparassis crispa]GBE78772.1 GDT1-like protein [Sparassis crispa]